MAEAEETGRDGTASNCRGRTAGPTESIAGTAPPNDRRVSLNASRFAWRFPLYQVSVNFRCKKSLRGLLHRITLSIKCFQAVIPKRGTTEMSGRISPSLGPSGHVDDFTRRNLPPSELWPELLLDRAEFQYPEYLNAAVELTDRNVEKGFGDHIALIGNGRQRTYKELADWSNRLAHALVENYGVKPGNRVLIRSGNNPALVAASLAATKAGAVVVNTMPMLRAGELTKIVDKAEIALALTDSRIADELVACRSQ